jgi:membrane protein
MRQHNFGAKRLVDFVMRIVRRALADSVPGQAARLSFYFLLAIFPLLLFLTALLGMTMQGGVLLDEALRYVRAIAPPSAYGLVDGTLREITEGSSGGKLSFGLLFSLWVASSGMVAVIEALNIAYRVKEFRRWWKRRLVAMVLTIGYVLLISVALLLLLYGAHAAEWLAGRFALGDGFLRAWVVGEWLLVLAFVLLAFNLLYLYGPNVTHRSWRWFMPGTAVAVVLWILVSFGFRLYLTYFNRYTATYGSIGAVIVLLLWFHLTGMALLVGGEVNSELERSTGDVEEKHEP